MVVDQDAVLHRDAGGLCQAIFRHNANAHHDAIGRDGHARIGIDLEASTGQRPQCGCGGAEADIDAGAAMALVNERGRFLVADPRQDARRDLHHGGLHA